MDYLQQHFPKSFEAIERLMVKHGAPKRDGDDTEWRTKPMRHHLSHANEHAHELDREHGDYYDPDSGEHQLVHAACRMLMALEVELGGGK